MEKENKLFEELSKLSVDELKIEYGKLINDKKYYEVDLVCTEDKIKDYRTPSNEISELRADIIYDENRLLEIDEKIKIFKEIAETKGIDLDPKILQKKNDGGSGLGIEFKSLFQWLAGILLAVNSQCNGS